MKQIFHLQIRKIERGEKKAASDTAPITVSGLFLSAWIKVSIVGISVVSVDDTSAHLDFARQNRQVEGELELRVGELAAAGVRGV